MRKKSFLTTLLTLVTICLMALGLAACNNASNPSPVPDSDPVNITVTVQLPDGSAATGVKAQLGNASQKLTAVSVDANGKAVIDVKSLLTDGVDTLYLWLSDLPAEYIFAKADGTEYGAVGMAVTLVVNKTPVATSATVKLTAKPEPEPKPEPVDVGVFARKWFDGEYVLDLTAGTMTGYTAFEVTAIEGDAEDTVISCTADGLDMTLGLNDDGKLELRLADDAETVLRTFMPDPVAFAGSWVEKDNDWASFYFTISATPDEDGNYCIASYYTQDGKFNVSNPAFTRMTFDENGDVVLVCYDECETFFGTVTYNEFTLSADGTMKQKDEWWMEFDVTPYAFNLFDNYLTADNKTVLFDTDAKTVTYQGTETSYELAQTELGAGYAFTLNDNKYTFVFTPNGELLLTKDHSVKVLAVNPSEIEGDWTSAKGDVQLVVNGSKMTVKASAETEVVLTPAYEEGKVVYTFTYESRTGKLYALDEYGSGLSVSSTSTSLNGYFFSTEEREMFFDTFTDNCTTIQLAKNGTLTVTDLSKTGSEAVTTVNGTFNYQPTLKSMTFEYTLSNVTYYLMLVDEGILWGFTLDEGTFTVADSWLSSDMRAAFEELFTANLSGNNDYYTTGVDGDTVSFAFTDKMGESGHILFNGEEYTFFWDISYNNDILVPTLFFPLTVGEGDDLEIYICTVGAINKGLYMEKLNIETWEEAPSLSFVANSALEKYLGRTYVYIGEYFEETLQLTEKGEFWISTSTAYGADHPIEFLKYDYILQNTTLGFLVMFYDTSSGLYIYAYLNDGYATVMDIKYTEDKYTAFVGTYYADNGDIFTFTADGKVDYTKADSLLPPVALKGDYTLGKEGEHDKLTGVFTLTTNETDKDGNSIKIDYDFSIVNGVATLTPTKGSVVTLTKRTINRLAFVGNYTIGEGVDAFTLSVKASATGINMQPTLTVTSSAGGMFIAAFSWSESGNQVCTLSKFLSTEQYVLTYNGTTLTLSDGNSSKIVKQSVVADYSVFAFDTEQKNDDYTLVCVTAEYNDVIVPYFYLNERACASFELEEKNGALVLTMVSGMNTVTLTRAADGTVTATLPTPIPAPPVPPPPPLP